MSAGNHYEGERLVEVNGVPLLVHEKRGDPGQPLVVFLPGAIHLARVAYGHPGSQPEDFLGHWLAQRDRSFLAVSYPLELVDPVFDSVDPDLGLAAYAGAVAAHIEWLTAEWALPNSVTVMGWSAAGNIAPRLNVELASRGIDFDLFVALAATPAIPGLIFGSTGQAAAWASSDGSFTESGLLAHGGLRSFLRELTETDRRYGRTVIDREVYERHYLGNMPLNLFPGLDVQRRDGTPVVGSDGPLAESMGTSWADYPMVASLQPTWVTDARHALTDRYNWGFVQTNMLSATRLSEPNAAALSDAEWRRRAEVVDSIPARLTRVIEGGHMFFVGPVGAQQTIEAVFDLLSEAESIVDELDVAPL